MNQIKYFQLTFQDFFLFMEIHPRSCCENINFIQGIWTRIRDELVFSYSLNIETLIPESRFKLLTSI